MAQITAVQVRKNIREIATEYLRGQDGKKLELADFHVELLQLMFDGGYYVVNWPTDHMKSYTATFIFPILSLIDDPDSTHLICGANIADSESRVYALQLELETNERLVRDFPWIGKSDDKENRVWGARRFNVRGRTVVNRNYSVLAVSTTSKDVRGRRGKLIMDDIEGEDARTSPTKRENLLRWVQNEGWRCLEDRHDSSRPLLIALGTPYDPDSIYFSLEAQGWVTLRKAAYEVKWETDSMGKPWYREYYLWPRKREKILAARQGPQRMTKESFSIQYLMDPRGGDKNRLSWKEIASLMKADEAAPKPAPEMFVCLDPASGSSYRKADYCGMSVIGIDWPRGEDFPNVQIWEAEKITSGPVEQIHLAAQWSKIYGNCPVIVETNAMQRTYRDFFQHLHPETTVIPYNTTNDKKFAEKYGLKILPTLVRQKRLLAPPEKLETEGYQSLIREMRDLGQSNSHDHICCSIWFAIRHVYERVANFRAPQIVSGWNGYSRVARRDYVDREIKWNDIPAVIGYTRWGR